MSALVLRGDARNLPLPDASVDLIVTSPPYWNLRDYRDGGESMAGQVGSEATPAEYVATLLDCTAEWTRVLKPSGSMFVVLGDKYANDGKWGGATSGKHVAGLHGQTGIGREKVRTGFPAKSLMMLPQRYGIACIDELGLIMRAEICWAKVNGLPESINDRVRRSHETILHLTKRPHYYSAVDEIREPHDMKPQRRPNGHKTRQQMGVLPAQLYSTSRRDEIGVDGNPLGKLPGSVWEIASTPLVVPEDLGVDHFAAFPLELPKRIILGWSPVGICRKCGEGRHPVTDVSRVPLRQRDLPMRARLNSDRIHGPDQRAGTHALNRSAIAGYACACTPFTDHPERRGKDFHQQDVRGERGANDGNGGERFRRYMEELANPRGPVREYHFDAWQPAPTLPAVVIDPFGGTGTTALVADVLGRTGITIDRSADYCRLAAWRTTDPAERARALGVPKPPPVMDGQLDLFGGVA